MEQRPQPESALKGRKVEAKVTAIKYLTELLLRAEAHTHGLCASKYHLICACFRLYHQYRVGCARRLTRR